MQKIVVIGGGLSGTLMVINLLRQHNNVFNIFSEITVVERKSPGMLGQAYSTNNTSHLLNAMASRMSVFNEHHSDFMEWLNGSGYHYREQSFVPRAIYREYIFNALENELDKEDNRQRVTFLNDSVTDIISLERLVVLASGRVIPFDKIVLALGNFEPTTLHLNNNDYLRHPAYIPSSWDESQLKHITPANKVLILGAGLTMVDTVLSLQQQGHTGPIVALSTHGLTPMPHSDGYPAYSIADPRLQHVHRALDVFRIVREHVRTAAEQGISWHAVIDAIRPQARNIWLQLPVSEKKIFMEHLRHLWGVLRHRVPNECWGVLGQLLEQRRLSVVPGRIAAIQSNSTDGFDVQYKERGSQIARSITADVIVNCLGPESNYEKLNDPLIRNLIRKGLVRTDPMKQGLDCTPEGIVIQKDGGLSSFLYVIGPPTKGILWEITSVPEIRMAALSLAHLMASKQGELVY